MKSIVATILFTVACCGVSACSKSESDSRAIASGAASPTASSPPVVSAPWYVGSWSATFQLEPGKPPLSAKQGAPDAWEKGGDTRYVGQSELKVTIDEKGAARGESRGASGPLQVKGGLDGEVLRLSLSAESEATDALHNGFVVAERRPGDILEGTLQAGTGDGLQMRRASLKLSRQPKSP